MNVKKTVITAALILTLIPIQHVKALSSEKHGYGQGTATDSQNCPVGAADFNSQYNQYDAYALTNDKKRIIRFSPLTKDMKTDIRLRFWTY